MTTVTVVAVSSDTLTIRIALAGGRERIILLRITQTQKIALAAAATNAERVIIIKGIVRFYAKLIRARLVVRRAARDTEVNITEEIADA